MSFEQRLSLKPQLRQQLMLTPQLQQAIKLLMLNAVDLKQNIEEELLTNPVLEEVPVEAREGLDSRKERELEAGDAEWDTGGSEEGFAEVDLEAFFGEEEDPSLRPLNSGSFERPDPDAPSWQDLVAAGESLEEHLAWQARMSLHGRQGVDIALVICGNLTPEGYLAGEPAELAASLNVELERFETVRALVMRLDPVGCGARDAAGAMRAQLAELGLGDDSLPARLVGPLREAVEASLGDAAVLAKAVNEPVEQVQAALDVLRHLDPRPGLRISAKAAEPVVPDVVVRRVGDTYQAFLNDEGAPMVRISKAYRHILKETPDAATRRYLRRHVRNARWFVKSLEKRRRTIREVARVIVERQQDWFKKGDMGMRPLLLKDVAGEVEVHESTVSRVVNQKWMDTPHGLYPMRHFFAGGYATPDGEGMAVHQVKAVIKRLVGGEDPRKPLADDAIARHLADAGIAIARRTVAKYREELGIPASSRRRQRPAKASQGGTA